MIVETTLSYRDCASGNVLADECDVAPGVEPLRVVRMDSRSVPDEPGIGAEYLARCASGAEDIPGAAAGADAYDRFGSTLTRPQDYIAAVAVERFVCEVRVAVDERCATDDFFGHFL